MKTPWKVFLGDGNVLYLACVNVSISNVVLLHFVYKAVSLGTWTKNIGQFCALFLTIICETAIIPSTLTGAIAQWIECSSPTVKALGLILQHLLICPHGPEIIAAPVVGLEA